MADIRFPGQGILESMYTVPGAQTVTGLMSTFCTGGPVFGKRREVFLNRSADARSMTWNVVSHQSCTSPLM